MNSLDPNIPLSITDGLINGDFAFSNLALAAGQVSYLNSWDKDLINIYYFSGCSTLYSGQAFSFCSASQPPGKTSQDQEVVTKLLEETLTLEKMGG